MPKHITTSCELAERESTEILPEHMHAPSMGRKVVHLASGGPRRRRRKPISVSAPERPRSVDQPSGNAPAILSVITYGRSSGQQEPKETPAGVLVCTTAGQQRRYVLLWLPDTPREVREQVQAIIDYTWVSRQAKRKALLRGIACTTRACIGPVLLQTHTDDLETLAQQALLDLAATSTRRSAPPGDPPHLARGEATARVTTSKPNRMAMLRPIYSGKSKKKHRLLLGVLACVEEHGCRTFAVSWAMQTPANSRREILSNLNRLWDAATSHPRQAPSHKVSRPSVYLGDPRCTNQWTDLRELAAAHLRELRPVVLPPDGAKTVSAETGTVGSIPPSLSQASPLSEIHP